MPFKEKIAWISVVTTVIVWGTYFAFLLTAGGRHDSGSAHVTLFLGAVVAQLVLVIIGSITTAIVAPDDAAAGTDERDRTIARHSAAVAYPVLVVGVVLAAASMHLGFGKVDMVNCMMAAIVVAEIVHYGAKIAFYRSGRHG